MADIPTPATDLREGDLVDLQHDPFYDRETEDADPDHDACRMAIEFEYQTVAGIERETPDCVRVDFDGICSGGSPRTTG
jgi:hypothetical protein